MGGRRAEPRTRLPVAAAGDRAWLKRVRSREFKESLEELIGDEIEELGRQPLHSAIDQRLVRRAIESWDSSALRADVVAKIALELQKRTSSRLGVQKKSIRELLEDDIADRVDSLIDGELLNPRALRGLVEQTMRQEFVGNLFAEIIRSAIISFNDRFNPLFGGLTRSVLDSQLASFLRLVMPLLQDQAVAFALSASNQKVMLDLSRSLARTLLAEPVANLAPPQSAAQRKQVEVLMAEVLGNPRMQESTTKLAVRMWDDLYGALRNRKLAQIVDLGPLADAVAEPIAEITVRALARPRAVAFFARAMQ